MKKISKALVILTAILMIYLTVSSCKSTQLCPAYGEVQKYQKEVRR